MTNAKPPKPRRGRPTLDAGQYRRPTTVSVYLDGRTRAILERLGAGSLSAGIRTAARLIEPHKVAAK